MLKIKNLVVKFNTQRELKNYYTLYDNIKISRKKKTKWKDIKITLKPIPDINPNRQVFPQGVLENYYRNRYNVEVPRSM